MMKKDKLFAPFLMLFAGAIASIVMFQNHYDTKQMLTILLVVLIVFYLAGYIIQNRVRAFVKEIKEKEEQQEQDRGEVIEKEIPAEEENGTREDAG